MNNFSDLEKIIDYNFKDKELLLTALTHPSCFNDIKIKNKNYERLELLGDAVLSLIIIEMLLKYHKNLTEGEISKRKANLVCSDTLSDIGKKINIENYIIMSKGEEKMNGRNNKNNIENVVESLIGAIYLDSGIEECKRFINKYWIDLIKNQKELNNPKSKLQEWLQKHNYNIPKYTLINEEGNKGNPIWTIQIEVDNLPIFQEKSYKKKDAEINLANDMIKYIKNNFDKNI